MKTRLKNLSITSVDLVDRGANQDAHVRLFKRRDAEPEPEQAPDTGLFQKFAAWLTKSIQDVAPGSEAAVENSAGIVEKEAQTFAENAAREQLRAVTCEMSDSCYALSDSFGSIICDGGMSPEEKKTMLLQSLDEFAQAVRNAAGHWANGQKAPEPQETQAEVQKTENQTPQGVKEETDTMKIDKSKMSPEEQAVLEELEKKYGIADDPAPADGVEKNAEPSAAAPAPAALHPDVAKALADFQKLTQRQSAEVEALKKSLEIERLTAAARKYEALGKKAPELAEKLYELKKAGGTVYDDYVALLDENLTALTKSGLFGELGSSRQGSAGTEQTLGIKAAELAKSAPGGLTTPEAIIKAWEENPELAAQYEAEYFGH